MAISQAFQEQLIDLVATDDNYWGAAVRDGPAEVLVFCYELEETYVDGIVAGLPIKYQTLNGEGLLGELAWMYTDNVQL